MKKTFAVILACMMLIFAFAGCGKKADTTSPAINTEEVSEAPTSEAPTSEAPTSETPTAEVPSADASTSPAA